MFFRSRVFQHPSKPVITLLGTIVLVSLAGILCTSGLLSGFVSALGQAQAADARFLGLRKASPSEIRAAVPEAGQRPILVEFTSRFCHDCQRLSPVVTSLMPKYPSVYLRHADILEDREKAPVLFSTFKPVSVPVLVFIDRRGVIRDVLYNVQPSEKIAAALQALQISPAPKASSTSIRKP